MNSNYGGLEIFFSYPPAEGLSVSLSTNIGGVASFREIDDEAEASNISVKISSEYDAETDKVFIIIESILGIETVDKEDFTCDLDSIEAFDLSIFFFNARISVYLNKKWVYSYNMYQVVYPVTMETSLIVNGDTATLTNIKNVEIPDGREAVYVDYESTSDNAFSSIIQERPIEIFSAVDRKAEFTYDATKNDVEGILIKTYEVTENDSRSVSSDGLVYAIDVGVSIDLWVAENLGLITRLYRLSELDSGVERAAAALQKRARQSIYQVGTTGRFDPRLEISDVLTLTGVILTGTQTPITDRVILEDISFSILDGSYRQNTNGRRDVDNVEGS